MEQPPYYGKHTEVREIYNDFWNAYVDYTMAPDEPTRQGALGYIESSLEHIRSLHYDDPETMSYTKPECFDLWVYNLAYWLYTRNECTDERWDILAEFMERADFL